MTLDQLKELQRRASAHRQKRMNRARSQVLRQTGRPSEPAEPAPRSIREILDSTKAVEQFKRLKESAA